MSFYLGHANGKPLQTADDDFGHVVVLGPPGSGKTTGLILMNALTSDASLIVTDTKGDVLKRSGGFRKRCGHDIFVYAPGMTHSHRINPFDRVGDTPEDPRVEGLQNIANAWVTAPEKVDPIWPGGARGLFVGVALFVWDFFGRDAVTPGELYRFTHAPVPHADFIKLLLWRYRGRLTPECQRLLGVFAQEPDKTAGSIMATLRASLKLFENPLLDELTKTSDMDIGAFRKRKQDLYICADEERMLRFALLLTLLLEQILGSMSGPDPDLAVEPYAVDILGDEIGNFNKLERIANGITTFRSKHIRLCLILQELNQLVKTYGPEVAKIIIGSSKYRLIYTPNDFESAKQVSAWIGNYTHHTRHVSRSSSGHSTYSDHYDPVPLMSPSQVLRMSKKDFLLFAEATRPIYGQTPMLARQWARRRYYQDKDLRARAAVPPPTTPSLPRLSTAPEIYKPMYDELKAQYSAATANSKAKAKASTTDASSDEPATPLDAHLKAVVAAIDATERRDTKTEAREFVDAFME